MSSSTTTHRQSSLPSSVGIFCCVALSAPASAAPAPAGDRSVEEIRAEIEFARGLASEWQFVDLAEGLLGTLEAGGVDAAMSEELALVKCDIYAEGAKTSTDPDKREELYGKAVTAYQDFLDEYQLGEFGAQAERSYVDLCNVYGLSLERVLEDAVGEEAAEIRERIDEVLRDAVSRTGELVESMKAIPEPTVAEKRDLNILLFNRGQLYLTLAKTAETGEYYFNQAENTLEELAFTAGETSGLGMLAYLLMGELYAVKGDWQSSADYLEFVVDAATPRNAEAWQAIVDQQSPGQLQERWIFAERGIGGLVEAYLALEEPELATGWGLHYYNTWNKQGFNLSVPHGYLSLLSVARIMLSCGGFIGGPPGEMSWFATAEERDAAGYSRRQRQTAQGLAVALADLVNRDNRGNTLQVRAQRLISEIISSPGVVVEPEVLFEAAKGEQNAREYSAAVDAFKRVLAAIETEDQATQQLFAPKVYHNLGRTFDRMGRRLEAAMAYREGVTTWGGDPEFDPQNAEGYRRAMADVRRADKDDARLGELWREAENLVVKIGVGAEDVLYNQAKRVYDEKDYAAARVAFRKVPGNATNYEKALTYSAVCAYQLDDFDTSEDELVSYLDTYLSDPTNNTTSEVKLKARQEAKALATYFLGRLAYSEKKNPRRAIELLDGYDTKFADQTSLAPAALYLATNANLKVKNFDEADAIYGRMLEKYPSSKFTGAVAINIYKVLEREHQKAVSANDTDEAVSLVRRMAENLRISNRLASTPDFTTLRNESKHWMEIGEWELARGVLARIVGLWERQALDGAEQRDMDKFVYPDLGHALLELHNANDAIGYLDNLVPDPDDDSGVKAASRTVIDYCRSVTGWVTGAEGEFLEIPGVGGAERVERAAKWLAKIANSAEKWECEWYELKFDLAYAYYQWGQIDSAKKDAAMRQIRTLRTELGPTLKGGDGIPGMDDACGNDILRRRYLALWDLVQ